MLYRHEEKPLNGGMYISMITTIKGENPTIKYHLPSTIHTCMSLVSMDLDILII